MSTIAIESTILRLEAEADGLRARLGKLEAAAEVLRELLGDAPAPTRAPRQPKTKAKKEGPHHAPPGESRAALLPHLFAEWTAPGALAEAAGLSPSACRVALLALLTEGVVEHNGERAKASRWRLVEAKPAKGPRARKAAPAEPAPRRRAKPVEPEEDDDDIERDGPFAGEEDE